MTDQLPSCPRCGSADRVVTLDPPSQRHGRPLVDAPNPWPYECAPCKLLFTGTDAEWARMGQDRDKYRRDHEKRSIPGGAR